IPLTLVFALVTKLEGHHGKLMIKDSGFQILTFKEQKTFEGLDLIGLCSGRYTLSLGAHLGEFDPNKPFTLLKQGDSILPFKESLNTNSKRKINFFMNP